MYKTMATPAMIAAAIAIFAPVDRLLPFTCTTSGYATAVAPALFTSVTTNERSPISLMYPVNFEIGDRSFVVTDVKSAGATAVARSEEHTSELQSRLHLVCR